MGKNKPKQIKNFPTDIFNCICKVQYLKQHYEKLNILDASIILQRQATAHEGTFLIWSTLFS